MKSLSSSIIQESSVSHIKSNYYRHLFLSAAGSYILGTIGRIESYLYNSKRHKMILKNIKSPFPNFSLSNYRVRLRASETRSGTRILKKKDNKTIKSAWLVPGRHCRNRALPKKKCVWGWGREMAECVQKYGVRENKIRTRVARYLPFYSLFLAHSFLPFIYFIFFSISSRCYTNGWNLALPRQIDIPECEREKSEEGEAGNAKGGGDGPRIRHPPRLLSGDCLFLNVQLFREPSSFLFRKRSDCNIPPNRWNETENKAVMQ